MTGGKVYKVFIVAGNRHTLQAFVRLFGTVFPQRWIGTKNIQEADVVVFTGGADINPELYNQEKLRVTQCSQFRDELDLEAYAEAPDNALRLGICRGAQFLNVMAGGSLWQDVAGHGTGHSIVDRISGKRIFATSTHHQMMIPGPDARVIAVANCSVSKRSPTETWNRPYKDKIPQVCMESNDYEYVLDPEVVWYQDAKSLCFQPHPESITAMPELKQYFFTQVGLALTLAEKGKAA